MVTCNRPRQRSKSIFFVKHSVLPSAVAHFYSPSHSVDRIQWRSLRRFCLFSLYLPLHLLCRPGAWFQQSVELINAHVDSAVFQVGIQNITLIHVILGTASPFLPVQADNRPQVYSQDTMSLGREHLAEKGLSFFSVSFNQIHCDRRKRICGKAKWCFLQGLIQGNPN